MSPHLHRVDGPLAPPSARIDWLSVREFGYTPSGAELVTARLLADLTGSAEAPEAVSLLVSRDRRSHWQHPAVSCRLDRGLLWQISFELSLEVVECPDALFELCAPGYAALALPAPSRTTFRPGRPVRRRARAAALALALTAATGCALTGPAAAAIELHAAGTTTKAHRAVSAPLRASITPMLPGHPGARTPAERPEGGRSLHNPLRSGGRYRHHHRHHDAAGGIAQPPPPGGHHHRPDAHHHHHHTHAGAGGTAGRHDGHHHKPSSAGAHHKRGGGVSQTRHHAKPGTGATTGHPHPHPRGIRHYPHAPSGRGHVMTAPPAARTGWSNESEQSSEPVVSAPQTGASSAVPPAAVAFSHLATLFANSSAAQPPAFLVPFYQEASRRYHVPWTVLAAINQIETDYGRNLSVSSAGAEGWMQFMPGTWRRYGVAADGATADPYNPRDAILAAARYLQANGATNNLRDAVFAYNHAWWYVDEVLYLSREIALHQLHPDPDAQAKLTAMHATAQLLNGLPYVYGGGHGDWTLVSGYDCSGFVSAVLHAGGYLTAPVNTQALPGEPGILPGPGKWVTVFDRTDAPAVNEDHVIIYLDGQWWESGGSGGGAGVHQIQDMSASYLSTFNLVLHPRWL